MSYHLATRKIIKEWTDYNEHMNMAYYILIFDQAWETMLNKFQMGGENAKSNLRSTMVVETRTTYDNEVKEISLYIDLGKRKVTEFEEDKLKIMGEFIDENKSSFKSENLELSGRLKK